MVISPSRSLDSRLARPAETASAAMAASVEVLQSHLEFVLDERVGSLTPDQRRFLDVAVRHGLRLGKLVEDLEVILEAELGRLDLVWTRCDLTQLALVARDRAWPVAHVAGKPIEVTSSDAVWVSADTSHLGRLVNELVDLAVDQAAPGTVISVTVEQGEFSVAYEAEQSPSDAELGLAIAGALSDALGGDLDLAAANGRILISLHLPPETI